VDVPYERHAIAAAIRRQIEQGAFDPVYIYGDAHAGERIAEVLSHAPLNVQKQISY
jgi:hypothetical protein